MEILGNPSWLWGSVAYRVDYDDPRGSRSDCGFGGRRGYESNGKRVAFMSRT